MWVSLNTLPALVPTVTEKAPDVYKENTQNNNQSFSQSAASTYISISGVKESHQTHIFILLK
jgi:hypothetical protein